MREKKSQESNFIRHRVTIKIEGFRPERLISQALKKGINLRRIEYRDQTEVRLCLSRGDLPALRKLAASKYRLTVLRETGTDPFLRKILKNKMAIAGFGLFLLFFFAQTLFVREINVIGCRSITETSIRDCIAEAGLYEGAFRHSFDCDAIETKLFQTFDPIVWAKVAYEGGYVEVEISEGKQEVGEEKNEAPCDIIAQQDCYIEKIYTYRGRARVGKDDFVKKGDILISGTVPIEHPSYPVEEGKQLEHYVHASGKIVARIPYYFSFYIKVNGESKTRREKIAHSELRDWIKENIPESAEILNKDFYFDEKNDKIRVYGTIETRQQVGIEKEIVLDQHKRGTEETED